MGDSLPHIEDRHARDIAMLFATWTLRDVDRLRTLPCSCDSLLRWRGDDNL